MSVPVRQQIDVGLYILKQKLKGNHRYPLVLMLEPLFRCNLSCRGCGKIDYPPEILDQRLSVQQCIDAVEECGAPMVSIPGGEPLLHKEMPEIVEALIARKKYVILCTNGLLLEKKIDQYKPSPYFNWQIHLDGDAEDHDRSVDQKGVFDRAVKAIKLALEKGFRVNINCTLYNNAVPERTAAFFDKMMELGVNDITISPGYAYERAPDQEHFLSRQATHTLFRDLFRLGEQRVKEGKTKWRFSQSGLFLDFLAGNRSYDCTPWGLPTRNVFGWQRPCYLLGEGFVSTYKELMETTDWSKYGTGNYEKCANCMVHCGYEPSAAADAFAHPWRLIAVEAKGPRTEGPMVSVDLSKQRPAEFVFSRHVQDMLDKIHGAKASAPTDKTGT